MEKLISNVLLLVSLENEKRAEMSKGALHFDLDKVIYLNQKIKELRGANN